MMYIIGIVGSIIAVICFVALGTIMKNDDLKAKTRSKLVKIFGITGGICLLITIIALISTGALDSSDNDKMSKEEINCISKSSAYRTCRWNVWKDHCECK